MAPAARNWRKATTFGQHELDWMTIKGHVASNAMPMNASITSIKSDPVAKRSGLLHGQRTDW